MPDHPLIHQHLTRLAAALPADLVDELADGLRDTYEYHLTRSRTPDTAAAAALAEFGDPATITTAFLHDAPGRYAARALLATGPLLGAAWGAALLSSHAWTWPLPAPAKLLFALTLATIIAALGTAAHAQHHYRHLNHLAGAAGIALITQDAALLTTAVLLAPTMTWILTLAAAASITRITFTTRRLPALLAR
jgi:hypothetical protein